MENPHNIAEANHELALENHIQPITLKEKDQISLWTDKIKVQNVEQRLQQETIQQEDTPTKRLVSSRQLKIGKSSKIRDKILHKIEQEDS